MSLHHYQIDTTLDFGDIGQVPALVDGVVEMSGLFGPGVGYRNVRIDRVQVFLESHCMDVTKLISNATRTDLESEIESAFEKDRVGA